METHKKELREQLLFIISACEEGAGACDLCDLCSAWTSAVAVQNNSRSHFVNCDFICRFEPRLYDKHYMPTVFEIFSFRFSFWSNDHEPIHVHVTKADAEARITMDPEIKVDWNRGFKPKEIKKILALAETFSEEITAAWKQYFNY